MDWVAYELRIHRTFRLSLINALREKFNCWRMLAPFSFGIRMAREDGERSVDLLGEHHSSKLMRHGQRRKRNLVLGAGSQLGWETLRITA